jgi:cell pole-organizing protein PopZ
MSKPEATAAKSLEEIIASIRKSLAGQGGAAGGRGSASKSERIEPELAPLPLDGLATAPDPADGLFADRLAGALKGTNGGAMDDDLSDILAQDEGAPAAAKRSIPEPPVAEDKPPEMPWRADRGAARETAVATAPAELSRPEELRRSLPPLFGEGQTSAAGPTAAPLPPPAADGPGELLEDILSAPTRVRAPPADQRGPEAAGASARASEASPAAVAPETVPALGASGGEASVESGPAVAPMTPSPALANGAAKPSPALASRALEQLIAELLEPVIRQWLDSNLPRLIEKVVREEVVKAIAAECAVPKT